MENMDNLVLIGMPSSGKSTAGVLLAKRIGYGFIDCDLIIQGEEGKKLSEIIEDRGVDGFIGIEERVNAGIMATHCVIATGGSVVYSDRAMQHLKEIGTVVYLELGPEEVERRIPSLAKRGVVMRGNVKDVKGLHEERKPLYEKYADITVSCDGKEHRRDGGSDRVRRGVRTVRVCIFGAGAMGTSLGAALIKAGVPVELVSRNAAHVEALRTRGAVLTGSVSMTVPVTAMLPEEMAGKYDIIFLAIRQRGNREAAQGLLPYLKEDGALVSVQNGLPERALSEVFGADRVYGCALSWGAERIAPGEIQMTGGSFSFSLGAFGAGSKLRRSPRSSKERARDGGGASGAPLCKACRQRRLFDALRPLRPHLRRTCFAAQKACAWAHAGSVLRCPRRGLQKAAFERARSFPRVLGAVGGAAAACCHEALQKHPFGDAQRFRGGQKNGY